ncbi:MAG: hypothetical protein KAS32_23270 [Candidatus Peribacteraceae bacterium]|nr:hypothetical protein [Candidatus Peribacteraceae bacterium]
MTDTRKYISLFTSKQIDERLAAVSDKLDANNDLLEGLSSADDWPTLEGLKSSVPSNNLIWQLMEDIYLVQLNANNISDLVEAADDSNILTDALKSKIGLISLNWKDPVGTIAERDAIDTATFTGGEAVLVLNDGGYIVLYIWDGAAWSNEATSHITSLVADTADINGGTIDGVTLVVANNTITTTPSGNLISTELDAALDELQTDIDTRATEADLTTDEGNLSTHISDTTTHGTTSNVVGTSDTQTLTTKTIVVADNTITTAASGNLTSTELNASLDELQTDIDGREPADVTILKDADIGVTVQAYGPHEGKNYLINPKMDIWQRGTSGFTGTSYNYAADRYLIWRGALVAGMSVAKSTDAPTGFTSSMKVQRDSSDTSTQGMVVQQGLEIADSVPLADKTVTLSFWAKAGANYSPASSELLAKITTGTTGDESPVTLTGSSDIGSVSQAITTTWTRYELTGTAASTAKQFVADFRAIPVGTAGADDSFYITGIQLEEGSVATDLEFRPIADELALCQRYLPAMNSVSATYSIGLAAEISTTQAIIHIPFMVAPRKNPTGITVSGSTHITLHHSGANIASTAIAFQGVPSREFGGIIVTVASGLTAGYSGYAYLNTTSGQLLFTGCEL